MTRPIKAVLLSGLVFPGTGHIVLKQYPRGICLLLVALSSLAVIVTKAVEQALAIVDRINSGTLSVEQNILELAAVPVNGTADVILSIASLVFLAAWIVGMVDSYRLGSLLEKQDNQASPQE